MMKTAIGAGVLGLPYYNTKMGISIGLFFIIIGGVVTYFTMVWCAEGLAKTGTKDYATLVKVTIGKNASYFLNFIYIAIATFGTMVVYLLIITSALP